MQGIDDTTLLECLRRVARQLREDRLQDALEALIELRTRGAAHLQVDQQIEALRDGATGSTSHVLGWVERFVAALEQGQPGEEWLDDQPVAMAPPQDDLALWSDVGAMFDDISLDDEFFGGDDDLLEPLNPSPAPPPGQEALDEPSSTDESLGAAASQGEIGDRPSIDFAIVPDEEDPTSGSDPERPSRLREKPLMSLLQDSEEEEDEIGEASSEAGEEQELPEPQRLGPLSRAQFPEMMLAGRFGNEEENVHSGVFTLYSDSSNEDLVAGGEPDEEEEAPQEQLPEAGSGDEILDFPGDEDDEDDDSRPHRLDFGNLDLDDEPGSMTLEHRFPAATLLQGEEPGAAQTRQSAPPSTFDPSPTPHHGSLKLFDDLLEDSDLADGGAADSEPDDLPDLGLFDDSAADQPADATPDAADQAGGGEGLRKTRQAQALTNEAVARFAADQKARSSITPLHDEDDLDFDLGLFNPEERVESSDDRVTSAEERIEEPTDEQLGQQETAARSSRITSPNLAQQKTPQKQEEEEEDDFDFDLGLFNPEERLHAGEPPARGEHTPAGGVSRELLSKTSGAGRDGSADPKTSEFPVASADALDEEEFFRLAEDLASNSEAEERPYRGEPIVRSGNSSPAEPLPSDGAQRSVNPFAFEAPTGVHDPLRNNLVPRGNSPPSESEVAEVQLVDEGTFAGLNEQSELLKEARNAYVDRNLEQALELVDEVLQAYDQDNEEARALKTLIHEEIEQSMLGGLGDLDRIPQMAVGMGELASMDLDHRCGFLLSQIDGTLTFQDLIDLSSMPRHETISVLADLLAQGAISTD